MDRADLELINKIMDRAGAPRATRTRGAERIDLADHFTADLSGALTEFVDEVSDYTVSLLGRVIREYLPENYTNSDPRTEAIRRTYRAIIGAHLAPATERGAALETAQREISTSYLIGSAQRELIPA